MAGNEFYAEGQRSKGHREEEGRSEMTVWPGRRLRWD
jgi:hypothetical protein